MLKQKCQRESAWGGACQPFRGRFLRESLCRGRVLLWLVDPHGGGQRRRLGWFANEAFGVGGVGRVEDVGSLVADESGSPVVHGGRRVKPDARVPVLVVTNQRTGCRIRGRPGRSRTGQGTR